MNNPTSPCRPGGTYAVPSAITQNTLAHLRAHLTEAPCFWLGRSAAHAATIEQLWIPYFGATPVSYDITPIEMLRLKARLDVSGQSLLVQVHSHPGSAFHSSRDDLNAASPWPGFISLVVPSFGNIAGDFWEEVEAYELLGASKWRHLSAKERRSRFLSLEAK